MNNTIEITERMIWNLLPVRTQYSHKGSFGSILNIAGSKNYQGAAYLSSVAPLRIGAGYVTLAAIGDVIKSVSAKTSEIVFFKLNTSGAHVACSSAKMIEKVLPMHNVVSVGCGLGALESNKQELKDFMIGILDILNKSNKIVVFDADALNLIAELQITKLPEQSIMTPHPKELSRLLNKSVDEIQAERINSAQFAAQKYSAVVILKGHNSIITDGRTTYINKIGNSALAKAGSGDVLTGVIAGLCAQGCSPISAAIVGVYLHGLAGTLAANQMTQYGVLASDLLTFIPLALKKLFDNGS